MRCKRKWIASAVLAGSCCASALNATTVHNIEAAMTRDLRIGAAEGQSGTVGKDEEDLRPTGEEAPVLLCTQYSIALQQCYIALQGVKAETEAELLGLFQDCLKGRNFATEPSACRRSAVSPNEAVQMILRGGRSGIPDFHR